MSPSQIPSSVAINVALVRRLVSDQFPQWADLDVWPVGSSGWDNRTYHLGTAMSVRLPSAAWYVAQVHKEHEWLPRLAPNLPLPIPAPIALGEPGPGYPWPWSIYRWLDGVDATSVHVADKVALASTLGRFLAALQRVSTQGAPPPGDHNFGRGGPLSLYDQETRHALRVLEGRFDTAPAAQVWQAALDAPWHGPPVWVHGDVAAGNLLLRKGRLSAVIDFGCSAVGDPACDMVIAWTLFSGASREAFVASVGADEATLARGKGWALWKALILLAELSASTLYEQDRARLVLAEVLTDTL